MVGDITQNSVKLISFTLFLFAIFFLQAYFLPQNQYVIFLSDLRERVANIMQTRK